MALAMGQLANDLQRWGALYSMEELRMIVMGLNVHTARLDRL